MSTSLNLGPLLLAAATAVCLSPSQASASLVYLGTINEQGSGLGNVNTLLSLKPQGNGTTACGLVGLGNVTSACDGAVTQFTGGSNNQTYTLAGLGIVDAADLQFVFNVNEPDDLVTLKTLAISFFAVDATAGATLFHVATLAGVPMELVEVGSGIGGQGHLFGLDADEAALVTERLKAGGVIISAQFAVADAAGGFETLNVRSMEDEVTPNPTDVIPEPTSLLLLGSALLGSGLVSRRFR